MSEIRPEYPTDKRPTGKTYGVVIVGAGNISAAHIFAVEGLPNARVVGVVGQYKVYTGTSVSQSFR